MKRQYLFMLLLTALALTSLSARNTIMGLSDNGYERYSGSGFVGYVPDEIVVRFDVVHAPDPRRPSLHNGLTGVKGVDALGKERGVCRVRPLFPGARPTILQGRMFDLSVWYRIKFEAPVDLERVVADYAALPEVASAERIAITSVASSYPNDPEFDKQWHLDHADDHDVDAPEAWDIETGSDEVIVALMDTGVRYYHKDLGGSSASVYDSMSIDGNIWINEIERTGTPGVDDDGNGYIDDWVGYDFCSGVIQMDGDDCGNPDNDPRDWAGHGTHCAGIVAAMNNNNYGVGSTAGGWGDGTHQPGGSGVKIMCLRLGPRITMRMDDAAEAFYYAADNGARIASCSWFSVREGGIGAAVDYFVAHGGLIFKAGGNSDTTTHDYLNGRDDVIAVAALDSTGVKAPFSNYGAYIDIAAPGDHIYSTLHDHLHPNNDAYSFGSGTSMACPQAAAVAALIWSRFPTLTAQEVEEHLYRTVDNIYVIPGNYPYFGQLGAGKVNAYTAVNQYPPPPAPALFSPVDGKTFMGPATVRFDWLEHEWDYLYKFQLDDNIDFSSPVYQTMYNLTESEITVSDLDQRTYYWRVGSANFSGAGPWSEVRSIVVEGGLQGSSLPRKGNFPNPFNPATTIHYVLPASADVTLDIYDVQGRHIVRIIEERQTAGHHSAVWDGRNEGGASVASGVYFYRLSYGGVLETRKMMLIR